MARKAVALLGSTRVGHVMLVYALLLLVWSVLGVQLLGGGCRVSPRRHGHRPADNARRMRRRRRRVAAAAPGSFDNVGSASLLLFEVSTLEGWASVMYAAVDASPERDSAPVAGATPWAALFVVSWVLLGGWCSSIWWWKCWSTPLLTSRSPRRTTARSAALRRRGANLGGVDA